jgi:protein-S-isoprenylcysteine O-methyltransferase Ste14
MTRVKTVLAPESLRRAVSRALQSASRNLARILLDLFVIGRSSGCLCDSNIAGRFLGSDAAAGVDLLLLLAGGGLVVWWLDCGRG